jgi:uncharacterized protein YxeA
MKDNELHQKIEQFDGYPFDYPSNVKTQQKLIEDSVCTSQKKSIFYFSKPFQVVAASTLLIVLSITGYFIFKAETNRTKYFVKTEKIKSENPTEKQSDVIQTPIIKTNQYNSKSQQFDTTQIQVDTLKTHIYESAIIAFQSDTLVPQKEKPVIAEQHFFAKKQRIKEFNFEARTIAPASKKQKNMEFFVLKDGQFKILSKNRIKLHTIQYE